MTAMNEMTKTIDDLLDAMTLEEQVSLLSGEDFWSLPAIERLSIGKLRVSDGPHVVLHVLTHGVGSHFDRQIVML